MKFKMTLKIVINERPIISIWTPRLGSCINSIPELKITRYKECSTDWISSVPCMISLSWWDVHVVQASEDDSDNVLCCNILMSRRKAMLQFPAAMCRIGTETGRMDWDWVSTCFRHQPGVQDGVLQDGRQGSRVHLVEVHQVLQAGKLGLGPVQRKSIFAGVRNLREGNENLK